MSQLVVSAYASGATCGDTYDFGPVPVGSSASQVFYITNFSPDPNNTAPIAVYFAHPDLFSTPFRTTSDTKGYNNIGIWIMPGQSRIVTITFTPTAPGYVTDSFAIHNWYDQLLPDVACEITLAGTGI